MSVSAAPASSPATGSSARGARGVTLKLARGAAPPMKGSRALIDPFVSPLRVVVRKQPSGSDAMEHGGEFVRGVADAREHRHLRVHRRAHVTEALHPNLPRTRVHL